jgi:anti-sigma regulatory factor (Ser/Thr protein kinase)
LLALGTQEVHVYPDPIPYSDPWHYELQFPRDPRGPRIARVTLRAVLASHGLDQLTERAELLTSELTTNAVCHTSGPASVHLGWQQPSLRVSVWDTSPELPTGTATGGPRPLPSPDGIGGRGLLLLDVFADSWGGCAIGDGPWGAAGKTIWFELRLKDGPPPTTPALAAA